jgi:hypothetical protein
MLQHRGKAARYGLFRNDPFRISTTQRTLRMTTANSGPDDTPSSPAYILQSSENGSLTGREGGQMKTPSLYQEPMAHKLREVEITTPVAEVNLPSIISGAGAVRSSTCRNSMYVTFFSSGWP